jgi:hypothetical protein
MTPKRVGIVAIFCIAGKPEKVVSMATGIAGFPNGLEGLI